MIVRRLNGSDLSPSLPVWATGEEAEGDHREELRRLHVLNLFSGRATEGGGNGKEMHPLSEIEHQVAGSGQEAFEADPRTLR